MECFFFFFPLCILFCFGLFQWCDFAIVHFTSIHAANESIVGNARFIHQCFVASSSNTIEHGKMMMTGFSHIRFVCRFNRVADQHFMHVSEQQFRLYWVWWRGFQVFWCLFFWEIRRIFLLKSLGNSRANGSFNYISIFNILFYNDDHGDERKNLCSDIGLFGDEFIQKDWRSTSLYIVTLK